MAAEEEVEEKAEACAEEGVGEEVVVGVGVGRKGSAPPPPPRSSAPYTSFVLAATP